MSDIFEQSDDAATPLTDNEKRDLIPAHIAYRRELNAAEHENIIRGQEWALRRRRRDLLSEKLIKDLHRHMLGDVWRWPASTEPANAISASIIGKSRWRCACCSTM